MDAAIRSSNMDDPEDSAELKAMLPQQRDPEPSGGQGCRIITLTFAVLVIGLTVFTHKAKIPLSILPRNLHDIVQVQKPPAIDLKFSLENLNNTVLRPALIDSELQYRINLRNRWRRNEIRVTQQQEVTDVVLQADFLVPTYPCSLEGRFGFWGEGGKWICLRHYKTGKRPLVISIGSHGDTSFERAVNKRLDAFSHTFDFSLTYDQQVEMLNYTAILQFYNAGLAGLADMDQYSVMFPAASFLTVPEMLKIMGTSYVDVFKIDCEGCEFKVVEDMAKHYDKESAPFGQIQMEIHFMNERPGDWAELLLRLEGLGYRLFHAEINGWYLLGYEVALIHERLVKPQETELGRFQPN